MFNTEVTGHYSPYLIEQGVTVDGGPIHLKNFEGLPLFLKRHEAKTNNACVLCSTAQQEFF
jgi:inhibitor of KinA sporulation pathway (predicted exonuclease)